MCSQNIVAAFLGQDHAWCNPSGHDVECRGVSKQMKRHVENRDVGVLQVRMRWSGSSLCVTLVPATLETHDVVQSGPTVLHK